MQTENRLFDDLAKFLNGAAGTVAGMGREAQGGMQARMREWMGGMDFVGRDEFEAVKAMAAAARDEADALRARLDRLERARGEEPGANGDEVLERFPGTTASSGLPADVAHEAAPAAATDSVVERFPCTTASSGIAPDSHA